MIKLQELQRIQQSRREWQIHLSQVGVNRELIDLVVEDFYDRVRADSFLGPVFAGEIDDWSLHLAKMKTFWASIILKENQYSGKPVPAHQKLEGVTGLHFQRWLEVFEECLSSVAPTEEARQVFLQPAYRIAGRLQMAMGIAPQGVPPTS